MSTLLLVNPAAGHGRGRRLADEAATAITQHWGGLRRIDTAGPGDAIEIARNAEAGIERIVVLGGDGTLHEAANGVLQRPETNRPPITIISAGTGNDYARMIGTLGLRPAAAIARLTRGTVRKYDAGYAWDEYFINSIGIGFDAAVARRVNASSWGRGILPYVAAVIRVISEFRSYRATVAIDHETFSDDLLLVEVTIGYSQGGGFRLTPDALLDDGQFDLCAIRHLSTPALLAKLPLAMFGRHTRLPQVRMRRGTTVTIQSSDGPLLVQFDGEVRQRPGPIEIRILPGALPVLTTHA
ncbi:MAG TPA: diacylglycerol kinase family protein [Gemmatimonadales bacterium]|nr:diacylglycerol kinase family protein [Gemmatimonadales bacterium]